MSNRTDEQENLRIGRLLQDAREAKRITQDEIAESIGMSKNHISKIERGLSKASITVMEAYCRKLDMTPNEILGYRDEDIPKDLKRAILKLTEKQRIQLIEILKIIQS